GAALYTFHQPGLYAYVNHNLIEAILLGAAAHVMVDGDRWNHDLMTTPSAVGAIKPDTDVSLPGKQCNCGAPRRRPATPARAGVAFFVGLCWSRRDGLGVWIGPAAGGRDKQNMDVLRVNLGRESVDGLRGMPRIHASARHA